MVFFAQGLEGSEQIRMPFTVTNLGGRMVTTETHNQDFNTFFLFGAPVCNAYERIIVSSIPGSAFIKCSLLDLIETFTAAQINTYERL